MDIALMIVVMCIMMEVVLIMMEVVLIMMEVVLIMIEVVLIIMEVIFITCGTVEFGLHCCVAQALAGIEGRGYHNPPECSNNVNLRAMQGAFSHEAIAVCAPRARVSAPFSRTAVARTRRHALTK